VSWPLAQLNFGALSIQFHMRSEIRNARWGAWSDWMDGTRRIDSGKAEGGTHSVRKGKQGMATLPPTSQTKATGHDEGSVLTGLSSVLSAIRVVTAEHGREC